mmetsp:Transcript_58404/g.142834  ORF Transcript_58404/g.142834 Transcript_58404/m.142834 type:complete len:210 (-) Transcript_58404:1729-2358(-)
MGLVGTKKFVIVPMLSIHEQVMSLPVRIVNTKQRRFVTATMIQVTVVQITALIQTASLPSRSVSTTVNVNPTDHVVVSPVGPVNIVRSKHPKLSTLTTQPRWKETTAAVAVGMNVEIPCVIMVGSVSRRKSSLKVVTQKSSPIVTVLQHTTTNSYMLVNLVNSHRHHYVLSQVGMLQRQTMDLWVRRSVRIMDVVQTPLLTISNQDVHV